MTTSEQSNIKALAAKILALAEHPNTPEHEKDAAWTTLKRILLKHNLEISSIVDVPEEPDVVEVEFPGPVQHRRWHTVLRLNLCELFDCSTLSWRQRGSQRFALIGRGEDVEFVYYLFSFLVHDFKRIARNLWRDSQFNISQSSFVDSFCAGAAAGLGRRKINSDLTPAETALVVVKSQAVQSYMDTKYAALPTRTVRNTRAYSDPYYEGVEHGKTCPLTRPLCSDSPKLLR